MKFIPKYITTDILAEYGEHLTHEAYNEMVKLNSTQGDYNTKILNQLFNTNEGIQIPYLDNKIKIVTNDQLAINEAMEQVVADMAALAGSLYKYTTFNDVRRIVTESTQGFVKTNKIKAGENVDVVVDANNNVIISATGGGDVTKDYVDEQDATTLTSAKNYTDTRIPTNISAFNNDVGYITSETDPVFSASPAAGILSDDITSWNNKSDFSGNYADLSNKPDLSVYVDKTSTQAISGSKLFTTIPQTNKQASENNHIINKKYFDDHIPVVPTNISAFNNDSGYITGYTETDPVFSASPAAGITATDITNWDTPEVKIFNMDSNEVIDILGLKKGLYIVIGDTSASSPGIQKLCYSPFRQGTSYSSIALTGGYFYVTQDITNTLPNDSIVINYMGYGANDSIINLKIDNTKLSGITVDDATMNSYMMLNGNQTVNGSKTFHSPIKCNSAVSAYNHLTRLEDVLDEFSLSYDTANTYNTGDYVYFQHNMYVCKEDNVTGTWQPTKWENITSNINALNRLKQYTDTAVAGVTSYFYIDDNTTSNPFTLEDKEPGVYVFYSSANNQKVHLKYNSTYNGKLDLDVLNNTIFIMKKVDTNTADNTTFAIYVDKIGCMYNISKKTSAQSGLTNGSYGNTIVNTYVRKDMNQDLAYKLTFTTNLPESSLTPTTNNQLTNKAYVDSVAGGGSSNVNYLGDIENYTSLSRLDLNTLDAGVYIFNNVGPLANLYIEGTNDNIQFTADIPVDTGNNTYIVSEAFFTLYSKIEDLTVTSTREPFATFHYIITNGSDVLNRYVILTIRKDNGVIYVESPTNNKQFLNAVTLMSNQNITGKKTFSTLPESSITPTTANQFTNKSYVDSVAGGGNNKIVAIDTDQDFIVANMSVENCINTVFKQINITIKGESTSSSAWNISSTRLLSYRVLADYSTATEGDPVFVIVMFVESPDGKILVNYETFSKDTTHATGLSLTSVQDPTYSIPAKYWFFDESKQPSGFGQTDALHFINANRYQSPFVFTGKALGLYAFTPNGVYNGNILGHCFKGTSTDSSYYEIACLFLLIVKDYTTASNEDDIAIGFGAGDHGPMTFGFKKDTTQASGIRRTNMDSVVPSLYMNTFASESVNGVKTFNSLPKIGSNLTPNNMLQLVPYGFLIDRDAATYNTSNTYNKGDFVRYQNQMYQCTTDGTTGTWNSTKWTAVTTDILNQIIKYINYKQTYSTSETRIGTWTDGKPIYRKVIDITEFPLFDANIVAEYFEKTYSTSLTNVDTIVNLTGSYHNTVTSGVPSATFSLNYTHFAPINTNEYPVYHFITTRLSQDSSTITITCSSHFAKGHSVDRDYQGHVIIEYTKTTD